MDLFGLKAKTKITELEEANLRLVKAVRDMDQLIYNMSQEDSWKRMRPIFNMLLSDTNSRMRIESNRIRDLLIPEIKKAYNE